ncbi:MAG: MBL fold metallo-hydrolase [Flavobacteriales bacterium]|nr:MBL fold metallo-hydrolase [Flavobacteriales bacterium]
MTFKIHRGTQEVGGSCVEIWTDTTRIVVDIGMPLVMANGQEFNFKQYEKLSTQELVEQGILPAIDGLYENANSKVDGILISHYHQDHHGFLSYADTSIPVFTGEATKQILEFSEEFFNGKQLENQFQTFAKDRSFSIGDITIRPYWMDHSAFDAYGFLIEADGQRIFYSGDFRGHGRKGKVFKWFLHNAPQNVDYLLMEGTTIGRGRQSFPTEEELEEKFIDVFKSTQEINLINTSAQNIDRIVTIYRACKRTSKLMVVDVYTAAIMKEMASYATIPFPSASFPEIRVMYPYFLSRMIADKIGKEFLYQFQPFKITKEEISERRKEIVFLIRPSMKTDLDRIGKLENGNFIYSMWSGYLKQPKTDSFVNHLRSKGFAFHQIHTSGHADIATLKEMVTAMKPKNLVPIHTFDGDEYKDIFTTVQVKRALDGEMIR